MFVVEPFSDQLNVKQSTGINIRTINTNISTIAPTIKVLQPLPLFSFIMSTSTACPIPTTTSTTISIPPAIRSAFTTWLVSADNSNRARVDDEKYLEYKSFLRFPKSTLPDDLKNDREAKRRWSHHKHDALTNYELVNGQVYRRACKRYSKR